ncbi:MAG TPA: nucleotidyltransferase family protein [Puia sp.]|jgi:molybdenum cofactor cytidylyltransferase|nr:nucleotidyltransferase family protein [Puia sp.]
MLSAILLAAGSSRRMGPVNKLLLPWQDRTVIYHTAEQLSAAAVGELIVVTGHEPAAIETALHPLPVRFVHNPVHHTGMTSSIQTGIRIARGDGFMICLADMVLLTAGDYVLLKMAFEQQYRRDDHCIILPEYQNQTGNPVTFSRAYHDALLALPEQEGAKSLVRANTPHHFRVAMSTDHILRDLDTPGDYKTLPHR